MRIQIFLTIMLAATLPMMAQHDGKGPEKKPRPDISEVVGDLSAKQKYKVDNITKESKERVEALRKQQHAVRDSITMFMEREGNHSKVLFPLFDREAKLQAAVSREMYTTKLLLDEVLTKEQRERVRKFHSKDRKTPGK